MKNCRSRFRSRIGSISQKGAKLDGASGNMRIEWNRMKNFRFIYFFRVYCIVGSAICPEFSAPLWKYYVDVEAWMTMKSLSRFWNLKSIRRPKSWKTSVMLQICADRSIFECKIWNVSLRRNPIVFSVVCAKMCMLDIMSSVRKYVV